ncbi:MAG: mechanosensitive ion channel domain-containing protein, partial [Bacteroidota bacterium]
MYTRFCYTLLARLITLCLGLLLMTGLQAQDSTQTSAPPPPAVNPLPTPQPAIFDLSTPRQAVTRHLYYLRQSYQPEIAAEALFPKGRTAEELQELAIQLRDIYNSKGDFIDTALIPDEANFRDSTMGNRAIFKPLSKYPDIYLEKYGDQWRYSQQTVSRIPAMYKAVIPLGADFLIGLVPKVGTISFLGLKVWQYVGILLAIGIFILVFWVIRRIFGVLIRRVLPRLFPNSLVNLDLVPPITRPLAWLLTLILAAEFLIPPLLLPIGLGKYISMAIRLAIPVFSVILAYRLVDILAFTFAGLAGKTETTMDDQLVPLLSKTLKIIVAVFGVIFALQNLGVNVTALLAGVSIGGLAIALAAQDTVKNFIGSLSIFVDRPFSVGDFIDTGSFSGVVTEVGVRSTRLRAADGAQVTVPNGALVNMNITNHGVRTYRRYATTLGLTYD